MNVSEKTLNSGKEQLSSIARQAIPELEYPEADRVLNASKKLLVVRHPFERLLSAYRDKLENSVAGREHGTLHFYQKYGVKIVRKYRRKSPEKKNVKISYYIITLIILVILLLERKRLINWQKFFDTF